MAFPNINPTTTKSWKKLQEHFETIQDVHMKELFAKDKNRADKFTIKWDGFYVDYSKNRVTEETLKYLLQQIPRVSI